MIIWVSWYNLLMDIQEISAEKLLDIIEEKIAGLRNKTTGLKNKIIELLS